jgi:hypothetical protein
MKSKMLCLLALLACLTGCVPVDSLNPLYTEKESTFDQALLGQWVSVKKDESQSVLEFTRLVENGKDAGYSISMTSQDNDGKYSRMDFEGRLVTLGEHKFLDLLPRSSDLRLGSHPLRIAQSKSGANIEPRLLKVATGGYLEFTGGAQPQASLRAAHWFMRVKLADNKLRLDWADDVKLMKALLAHKLSVPHALVGEGDQKEMVITATSQQLQKFVAEHADDDLLFTEHTEELERKQP